MQKRSHKKPNIVRNDVSLTSTLYSRKTAKKINRVYMESIEEMDRRDSRRNLRDDDYDDYYDDVRRVRKEKSGAAAIVVTASIIIVVLAITMVGLTLLRQRDEKIDIVQAMTTEAEVETESAVIEESEPPVIYGVMPIVTHTGHSVAYKQGVYVTDDTDENPVLEIENDEVDLTTPGSYTVCYVARDKDQNVTRAYSTVTVLDGADVVSDDEINALADSVLDALITDDMTDVQKCLKIYEYLHAINYIDKVHSEDWRQNAYWMIKNRGGDCFGYYSAANLLLSRLGYDVMEVRNNNNYVHYWCLVSIDGGDTWWHFDACCWSWGEDGVLCLVSDDYLQTFTRRHKTSDGRLIHAWDMTNYPATPAQDFWTDEDRAVIYEGGLIEIDPEYDPDDDIWRNDGWDDYHYYGNLFVDELYTNVFDYENNYDADYPTDEVWGSIDDYTYGDQETEYDGYGAETAEGWDAGWGDDQGYYGETDGYYEVTDEFGGNW